MKLVFMGTPAFAVPTLEKLMMKHQVVAVVTQPDKPKGRGKKMAYSPVKEKALEAGIPVIQPEKVREPIFIDQLSKYSPDCIVVVAFGQILPEAILELPKFGCINVHGSLLPYYRGAAPMQWSVINGESETGITTMYMAKGMDTGDMLLKKVVTIAPEDTFGTLYDKMSIVGADLLLETLEGILAGTIQREVQNHDIATYAPMITKETGHISWEKTCDEIINLIRGLDPAPAAFCIYKEDVLKVWKAEKIEDHFPEAVPGEIVKITKKGFVVQAKDGCLLVTEVQGVGGKRMATDAYIRGHAMDIGVCLQ